MNNEMLLEIHRILNDPGMTWKVRRALLIHKIGLPEEEAKLLVPEPTDEFHPGDY